MPVQTEFDKVKNSVYAAIQMNQLSKLKQFMGIIPPFVSNGVTPLGFATRCNHVSIIRWLAEAGEADIDKPDSDGSTPLMVACRENHPKAAKELLNQDPNLNVTDQKGHTALHIACMEGHQALVKTLLTTTAAPNTQDMQGQTPLISAVMAEHKACVKILLAKHSVNLSGTGLQDSKGNTALMWAVVKGQADMAKLLLDNGADPNIKSNNGMTPLMVAASNGDAKVARLLLKHNADFQTTGPKGIAIDIALRGGHKTVASAIRQGVTRAWPALGLTGVTKVSKAKKGPAKVATRKGAGFLQDDGDIWVKGKGVYKPNGDFYADIPYFD